VSWAPFPSCVSGAKPFANSSPPPAVGSRMLRPSTSTPSSPTVLCLYY
jgi:hypothetical protein